MILTTPYLTFWTRVRKEFLAGFLVVTVIILYDYFKDGKGLGLSGLMILGFGIIYMLISLVKARSFVNGVKITEDKIIITGYNFDSRWYKEMDIKASDIRIKSKGQGRSNVEYYFKIVSDNTTVHINRSLNWDYSSLLTIFREFKRIKGEKIIFDEKYFLDIMEKKANGFSMLDIASGKDLKK